ncbi:GDP-L-fucose synthase [soil metagenome]
MTDFWADHRVLVTGGAGFLGRAVVARLEAAGATDIVIPRTVDADLRDRAATADLFARSRPDLVVHLAAKVGGIGYNQVHPAELYLDNLLMGTYVVEEARAHDVAKTVLVGTVCSYPRQPPVPFHEESLWDGYPEATNAPYGIAKLAQLVHAQTAREQYDQNVIYLIPTNLYGPGDKFHPAVSHVIPALIKKCIDAVETGADHIDLWGTGSASREFLYVDDAAEGIVVAAERYDDADPVNLGTDDELPIGDLVGHIAEATGFDGELRWDPTHPDGQPRRRVDNSRARERFGFTATTSFADGLEATVAWYLANRAEAEHRDH